MVVVVIALILFSRLVTHFQLDLQIVFGGVKDSFGGHWMNK